VVVGGDTAHGEVLVVGEDTRVGGIGCRGRFGEVLIDRIDESAEEPTCYTS